MSKKKKGGKRMSANKMVEKLEEFFRSHPFVGMTLEPFIYTTGVSYALRSDEAQAKQLEEKALLHAQRLVEAIEKA